MGWIALGLVIAGVCIDNGLTSVADAIRYAVDRAREPLDINKREW